MEGLTDERYWEYRIMIMADNLVQHLREFGNGDDYRDYEEGKLFLEAADRIEKLEAALRKIIEYETSNTPLPATWDVAKHSLEGK